MLGFAVSVPGLACATYEPFNLFPKTGPPPTADERAYMALTREVMGDGSAALNLRCESPHLRDKFESPDYLNLSWRVADGLRKVREAEPPERLRAFHADVILFAEKARESAALMSRYSYSPDRDTANRASEAMRGMERGADDLNRVTGKLNKGR